MEAEPVQFLWRHYEERLEPSRRTVAKFVGARRQDMVFVSNATSGVNAVVRSLRLSHGDELLTTNHDYNACHNVLAEAARRSAARLRLAHVPFPLECPEQVVEAVLRAVTPRTRLALIDYVTSNSGMVFPVEDLVHALDARGVDSLLDAAHAPGMVPMNLSRLRPAFCTGNLHKWVCAPKGAAFLWAREDKQEFLQPAVISHGNNTPRHGYSPFQDRFDWAGTCDPTAWFCAGAAVEWMGSLLPGGWTALRRRNRALAIQARRLLCDLLQIEPPCPESMLGALATLPLPERFQGRARKGKIDREQVALYDRFGIEVPLVRLGAPERRYFRISAQIYNSIPEYEYLGQALSLL